MLCIVTKGKKCLCVTQVIIKHVIIKVVLCIINNYTISRANFSHQPRLMLNEFPDFFFTFCSIFQASLGVVIAHASCLHICAYMQHLHFMTFHSACGPLPCLPSLTLQLYHHGLYSFSQSIYPNK